jgi:hypothetical protein
MVRQIFIISLLINIIFIFTFQIVKVESENNVPWTYKDSWFTGNKGKIKHENASVAIFKELIFPIPDSKLDFSINKLSDHSLLELDIEQVKFFIEKNEIDIDLVLDSIIEKADLEVQMWLNHSLPSEAIEFTDTIIRLAEKHRNRAQRARKLKGKLKPYLVRAVALNELTGGFGALINEDELLIIHSSLAYNPVPMEKRPIIIFLSHEPKKVYTSVSLGK